VGPGTQEIRAACVMTGGVSLAIWMGGVTRELNLLQHASWVRTATEPGGACPALDGLKESDAKIAARYVRLLELLDVTVDVDILSGTSAGGINAALFGLSRASGLDLGPLRDLWLRAGAFETLLRDPRDDKPPSLLYGDRELLRNLFNGIGDLRNARIRVTDLTPPTRIFITTTWLSPETSRFTDALGTLVQDSDHAGLLDFDENTLANPAFDEAVALAARTSASFPGAFEPSFVPFDAAIPSPGRGQPAHPAMMDYANTTRAHWAADGGILLNEPIQPLLREVFRRPAERQVRRVLLYVVPLTGDDPDPRSNPVVENIRNEITLGEALLKDLGAVLNQSITGELRDLREHNDRVDALRDTRLRMAELGARIQNGKGVRARLRSRSRTRRLISPEIFADYTTRQARWLVRPVVTALMREVTTMDQDELPECWRNALAPGKSAEEDCRTSAWKAVKGEWPDKTPSRGKYQTLGEFGLAPFDGAWATVLAMLGSAYVLADPARRAPDPSSSVNEVEYLGDAKDELSKSFQRGPQPNVRRIVRQQIKQGKQLQLTEVAAAASTAYAQELAKPACSSQSIAHGWKRLSGLVAERADWLRELLKHVDDGGPPPTRATPERPSPEERRRRAAAELRTYLDYLGTDGEVIAVRLFDLHAATRSVLPAGAEEVEQKVELVQVSADTRTVLDPARGTAATKLTGRQFHHFGAFYKSSWRASDWMWGRLDGSGWLVHLLLDPRRVLWAAERQPAGDRAEWFYNELLELLDFQAPADEPMERPPTSRLLTEKAVKKELSYLDDHTKAIPASLPVTALWVARTWQRDIAATELPVVAKQIQKTDPNNSWAGDVLEKPELPSNPGAPGTDPVAVNLSKCPVPDETFGKELATPLFRRTATKAAAVTTASVGATIKNPPSVVRSVLATVRTVTLAGYRAVKATSDSVWWLVTFAVLSLAAGVWGLIQDTVWLGLSGIVLVLLGAYLITIVAWGKKFLLYVPGVTLVVAVGALVSPVVREKLFGESDSDLGVVGDYVIPWLQDPWWHVVLVLGGLALVPAAVGIVLRLIRKPRGKPKPVPSTR
jgi:patatin-related protein